MSPVDHLTLDFGSDTYSMTPKTCAVSSSRISSRLNCSGVDEKSFTTWIKALAKWNSSCCSLYLASWLSYCQVWHVGWCINGITLTSCFKRMYISVKMKSRLSRRFMGFLASCLGLSQIDQTSQTNLGPHKGWEAHSKMNSLSLSSISETSVSPESGRKWPFCSEGE